MSTIGTLGAQLAAVAGAGEWCKARPAAGTSSAYANHAGLDEDGAVGTVDLAATLTRTCWLPVLYAPQSCVVFAAEVVGDRTAVWLSLGVDHHRPARYSSIRGLMPHSAQMAAQLGRRDPRAAAVTSDTKVSIAGPAACAALGHVTRGHRGVTRQATQSPTVRPAVVSPRVVEWPRGRRETDPASGEVNSCCMHRGSGCVAKI